jgi:hypothetical protein
MQEGECTLFTCNEDKYMNLEYKERTMSEETGWKIETKWSTTVKVASEKDNTKSLEITQWKSYAPALKTKARIKDNNWSERVKIDKAKKRGDWNLQENK